MHVLSLDFLIKLRMPTNDICLFLTIAKMGSVVVVVYLIINLVNVLSLFSFVTVHFAIFFKFKFFCVFTLTDRIFKRGSVSAGEPTRTANSRKGSCLSTYLLGIIYLFPGDD